MCLIPMLSDVRFMIGQTHPNADALIFDLLEGALACETNTIWIARDLGYRGGRRTGVPLTDETGLMGTAAELQDMARDRGDRSRSSLVIERFRLAR